METTLKDKTAPKSAAVAQKSPVVVVEFSETPDYRAAVAQDAKDRDDDLSSSRNIEALLSPKPLRSESNDTAIENSNNLLLTEEETACVEAQQQVVRIAVGASVFCVVVGLYFAYKWGYFSTPSKL